MNSPLSTCSLTKGRRNNEEVASLGAGLDPAQLAIETTQIRPRKSDISVGTVGLVWMPWKRAADGTLEPLF